MFSYIKAILFALLGGVSSVLPLSATFNISFLNGLLGGSSGETHLYLSMVMFGAASAILLAFYRQMYDVLFSGSEKLMRKAEYGVNVPMFTFKDVLIGCAPLILLFFPIGKGVFLFNVSDLILDKKVALAEGVGLIASGVVYFAAINKSIKTKKHKKFSKLSMGVAGAAQLCSAILPGASHTALTFSTSVMFRHRKNKAVTYSYLLAFPALVCAGFLHIILGTVADVVVPVPALIVTYIVSAFSAAFGILVFSAMAGEKKSRVFSYVNIALGLLSIILFAVRLFIK